MFRKRLAALNRHASFLGDAELRVLVVVVGLYARRYCA